MPHTLASDWYCPHTAFIIRFTFADQTYVWIDRGTVRPLTAISMLMIVQNRMLLLSFNNIRFCFCIYAAWSLGDEFKRHNIKLRSIFMFRLWIKHNFYYIPFCIQFTNLDRSGALFHQQARRLINNYVKFCEHCDEQTLIIICLFVFFLSSRWDNN